MEAAQPTSAIRARLQDTYDSIYVHLLVTGVNERLGAAAHKMCWLDTWRHCEIASTSLLEQTRHGNVTRQGVNSKSSLSSYVL